LYTILQILSVSLFEKIPIEQALSHFDYRKLEGANRNQLNLFK
ncbi:MAG: IS4 family transposase, partial [Candidatus Krumholzibacteriota bacterium]